MTLPLCLAAAGCCQFSFTLQESSDPFERMFSTAADWQKTGPTQFRVKMAMLNTSRTVARSLGASQRIIQVQCCIHTVLARLELTVEAIATIAGSLP